MPYRPEEEFVQGPETEYPVTPTKESRNHGASHADPDAADPDRRSDEGGRSVTREKDSAATPCFGIRGCQALGH